MQVEPEYFRYLPKDGSFATRLGGAQRLRLFQAFMDFAQPSATDSLLDVGVTASAEYAMNNYLELLYPYKGQITASGVEPDSYLPEQFPGVKYVQLVPGRLPFEDGSFDYVHASAVIEHVGSRQQQQDFLAELWRVCRKGVFVTTPNRWAPVEYHTVTLFLHWLPAPWFRACLRKLGRDFFADEANLNVLGRSDLAQLAQRAGMQGAIARGIRLFGWPSNLWLAARRP